jgi:hypothetical protein
MNMCKLRIYEDLNLNPDSNNSKSDYNQPIHMEYELLYFGNQNLIITQHIPTCIIKYRDYKKYLYDNNFLLQKYSRTYNSVSNFLKWIKSNPDPTAKPDFDSLHGYLNSLCGYLNYYLSFNYEQYYEFDYLKKLNFFFKNMINPFLYGILDNFDNTKYENNINQQKFINLLLIFINKWKENFDVNNTSKDSDKLFIEYANLLAIIYELIEYNISDNIITELVIKFITPRYNNIEFYYYKRTDVINVYFVELKNRVPKLNNIKNKLNNSTKKHTNNLTNFNNKNTNTKTKTKTITN